MRKVNWRRAAAFGAYTLAILSVGAMGDVLVCGSNLCIIARTSDYPDRPLGPFVYTEGAFVPPNYAYSSLELAQNYAALYYAQFELWKRLQEELENGTDSCNLDLNGSGKVDMADLVIILSNWGDDCSMAASPAPEPHE